MISRIRVIQVFKDGKIGYMPQKRFCGIWVSIKEDVTISCMGAFPHYSPIIRDTKDAAFKAISAGNK
jgi:hypothetical protein